MVIGKAAYESREFEVKGNVVKDIDDYKALVIQAPANDSRGLRLKRLRHSTSQIFGERAGMMAEGDRRPTGHRMFAEWA
jgi:hypothetical protein